MDKQDILLSFLKNGNPVHIDEFALTEKERIVIQQLLHDDFIMPSKASQFYGYTLTNKGEEFIKKYGGFKPNKKQQFYKWLNKGENSNLKWLVSSLIAIIGLIISIIALIFR